MSAIPPTAVLPAEWHPQDGVLLIWPHPNSDWAPLLDRVEPVFEQMISAIAAEEIALVVAYDQEHLNYLTKRLARLNLPPNRLWLSIAPSNDTWARDSGPLTIFNAQATQLINYQFNGWGGKYPHQDDSLLVQRLAEQSIFKAPLLAQDRILEGGGIDSNGQGSLLTTTTCLLTATRGGFKREDWEQTFQQTLGIQQTHWIENAWLEGDDTDGHIDNLARFTNSQQILYASCEDTADSHFASMQALETELKALRNIQDQAYECIPLPLPSRIGSSEDDRRLPASYANFLIINNAVLVPSFGDPNDAVAMQRLQSAFPNRKMIPIDSRPLVEQNGGIHCLTMQLPRGTLVTKSLS
ncbi:MAG: agmatine deiminase family protein [Gammaproteobacteria bacterium]|nr:agmatine deiminase family protein [Gammaproteobacteria bacterium]